MWHGEFRHPRLVDVYDAQFAWSREDDFFLEFVNETPAARVADVGCGTGRLTVALAAAGHQVMGVALHGASLDAARAKPGAEHVRWIEGTSGREAVRGAGMEIQEVYGGWTREPVGSADGELLMLARRPRE